MKITTLSSFAVATVALALIGTTEARATTGCAASKAFAGLTSLNAPTEGDPTAGLGSTPDAKAMAKALGGLGIVATLVTGGTLLYRRQRSAEVLAEAAGAEPDFDFAIQSESVLVKEVLLAEVSPAAEAESAEAVLSR
jgi:hypothetical protein